MTKLTINGLWWQFVVLIDNVVYVFNFRAKMGLCIKLFVLCCSSSLTSIFFRLDLPYESFHKYALHTLHTELNCTEQQQNFTTYQVSNLSAPPIHLYIECMHKELVSMYCYSWYTKSNINRHEAWGMRVNQCTHGMENGLNKIRTEWNEREREHRIVKRCCFFFCMLHAMYLCCT